MALKPLVVMPSKPSQNYVAFLHHTCGENHRRRQKRLANQHGINDFPILQKRDARSFPLRASSKQKSERPGPSIKWPWDWKPLEKLFRGIEKMTNSFHKGFLYGTVALAVMAVPAQAEPGSSDRLLDLERIIEQQQQMIKNQAEAFETLKLRIETVEGRTQANSEAVTAATRSVRRIDSAANPPKMTSSGNPHVKLSVSGWVSRKIMWADDGKNERVANDDDINLPTRWRFKGKAKVDEKFSLGTQMEVGMSSNPSFTQAISPNTASDLGGQTFQMRKAELWLSHKDFGTIEVGQGDPFANSVNHNDVTGTISAALPFGARFAAGGIQFTNPNNNGAQIGLNISSAFNDFDHVSRQDRVTYKTPKFNGFQLGASYIDASGSGWDVGLKYKGKIGSFKVKGGVGYTNAQAIQGVDILGGTVSVAHTSGISGVFGGAMRNPDGPDAVGRETATSWYGKLVYSFDGISYGKTGVGGEIQVADDVAANGDEATYWGIFVNQQIKKGAADIYAKVGNYDLDRPGTATDDIWIVQIGSRINF